MIMRILSLIVVGTLLSVSSAQAQHPTNIRQLNQERRIDAGTRSGKLTRAEAARLKSEQAAISRLERRLKATHGGRLTAADKRLIHARQEQANRHILAQKHDSQRGKNHLKL
jgi:hypothetical protein